MWALLARIKSTEAELGSYLDLLETKRGDLACASLNEYPSFKAAVAHLRMDWQSAIDNSLIDADEDWPLSKVKQFVADRLCVYSQQYLQDSDMEDAADVDCFDDAFSGHQDDDKLDYQE